ncbi:MAG: hypothetical protein ACRD0Z_02280 [Acidimicrobiales bacterium]
MTRVTLLAHSLNVEVCERRFLLAEPSAAPSVVVLSLHGERFLAEAAGALALDGQVRLLGSRPRSQLPTQFRIDGAQNGADLDQAIFDYNHACWYVTEVLETSPSPTARPRPKP